MRRRRRKERAREVRDEVARQTPRGQHLPEFCYENIYDQKRDELCSRALVKMLRQGKVHGSKGVEQDIAIPSSGYRSLEQIAEDIMLVAISYYDDESKTYRFEISEDKRYVRATGKQAKPAWQ